MEVTLEANPGTVDLERLRAFRSAGVNRLTLGCQTFQPALLEQLGRLHSVAESMEAIEAVGREGGEVIAEAALVDRSSGTVELGVPFIPLIQLSFPTYSEDEVPEKLAKVPVTKPGSRKA